MSTQETAHDDAAQRKGFLLGAADRVLSADFAGVPITRVTQFVVGWTRAAFAQSRVIVTLSKAGMASAAAPNRRAFAEIAVRLQWLHSLDQAARSGALDAMLENERELTEKSITHLEEMGFTSEKDLTDMREFVLEAAGGVLKDQARTFLAAAKSTEGQSVGLYYAWREETKYTHASGALAVAYAPASGDHPEPPVADKDLKGHSSTLFLIITLMYHLLVQEGTEPKAAEAILDSFLDVERAEGKS